MQGSYGLLGKKLKHSFSKLYFEAKFESQKIEAEYELYELDEISDFPELLAHHPELKGLNVTLPYKQQVISYLDEMDAEAAEIGAVNTIVIREDGTKGYNTDVYGFHQSLSKFIPKDMKKAQAIILGTGGASRAVKHVLEHYFQFPCLRVSRRGIQADGLISYDELLQMDLKKHKIIINATPVGMYPYIEECPVFPYEKITDKHLFYDLIYNPERSLFLQKASAKGAHIKNGLDMLYLQAERAWEIWNENITGTN